MGFSFFSDTNSSADSGSVSFTITVFQKNIPLLPIRRLKPGRNSYILETDTEFIIAGL